jgi:hypothetical protein
LFDQTLLHGEGFVPFEASQLAQFAAAWHAYFTR